MFILLILAHKTPTEGVCWRADRQLRKLVLARTLVKILENLRKPQHKGFDGRADRQRTLRELVLGRTLVKEDGKWLIRHGASDYKTGRSYGERPPLVIAESIYPYVRAGVL